MHCWRKDGVAYEYTKRNAAAHESIRGLFSAVPGRTAQIELREKAIRDYHSDMQENRELGREEGEHKKAKAVVFNMLRLGMDMEQIMAIADVTQQEAAKLRRTLEEGTT